MADSTSATPDDRPGLPGEETVPREVRQDTLAASGGSDFHHGRFEPGQRLGSRYRIVGLLGRGGMGEVYRADDLELGQSVALKFLPQRVAEDPTWLRRFRNEVRTARQIAHPNVCRIYDIAEVDGHVFLSMEYIDGEDLAGVLRRLGRPSAEKAIELARQICLGLAAAHENGVLHRDLKPPNIMIDGRGRARITDFGIAGFIEELEDVSARAGTPAYMAPEQLTRGEVSVRSDIYTLGLILHELFTGKCVFDTDDVEELKRQHTSGSVTTPSSVTTEIDPAVQRVIRRCLEQEPQQRPQSVYQVLAALPGGDPVAAALAAGETPSPEMIASARGQGGLRPAVAFTLLALCVAAVIWGAVATDAKTVMPVKGPDMLSVEAVQVMERLGHADLPANSAAGFAPINRRPRPDPDAQPAASSDDWPPNYRYWRRWANGSLMPSDFHRPYAVWPNDPPMAWPGDALVVLDSTGRLLRVDVIPDTEAEPLGETDWGAALAMLGVAESDAEPTEPVRKPKRPVDELRAWKVDMAPGAVVQAGAVGGRIVSFEVNEPPAERTLPPENTAASVITTILSIVAKAVMIILAIRNVRMRRSDLAAAVRLALVMAALEFVIELLSIRFAERPLLSHIAMFFQQRTAGHIAMHALTIFVAYVAIEPYARRLWPRLLVGTMRLVSGRVGDPLVGREMLVGSTVGIMLVAVTGTVITVTQPAPDGAVPRLHPIQAALLSDPSMQVIYNCMVLAWAMIRTTVFAILLVFARIVLRKNAAAIAVASTFVAFQFLDSLWWMAEDRLAVAIALALLAGAAIGATSVFSGLLSVYFALAMFLSVVILTFSLRLGEWYSVNTLMSAAFVLTFPVVGCWLSLAGQPIFKDVLGEPQPTG